MRSDTANLVRGWVEGMHKRNPWATAMQERMADGGWHDLDVIVRAGMPRVPPPLALDHYRRTLVRRRVHQTRMHDKVKARNVAQQIRDGRWSLCRRVVTEWAARGLVELDPPQKGGPPKRGVTVRVRWLR